MKDFFKKYSHSWIMAYIFIYLCWFFYLEKTVTSDYHIMHLTIDDYIPFCEYFIIPYLLWFVYVAATVLYFFFTDRKDYYKLCTMLFTGMTISLLVCTVFPNGTDFRPVIDPDKNICSALVSWLYMTDTNTNVFPSIHVYNSICVHIAISKSRILKSNRIIQISSFLLMLSICLATVFLKQHSVFDGVGAFIMAGIMYQFVYAEQEVPNRKKVTQKALG
ncbi:MAG TPA: phosphoesterase [Candidatus Hungatella pullicola]|nr:phosphoesterase [Candidatus Hungatella pullicola]